MKLKFPLRGLDARLTAAFFGMFLGAVIGGQTTLLLISFLGMLVFYTRFYNSVDEN
jgi:hypothetical protein